MFITVAADGSGDCRTIGQAIEKIPQQVPESVTIKIKNGVYKEKIGLEIPSVNFLGEDPEKTILTFDDCAKKTFPGGEPMFTFNSYSFYVSAPDFQAENITFANSAGDGNIAGQALAAYVDGDRMTFKNCRFLGCQDTLFTGPLAIDPDSANLNLTHPALAYGRAVPPTVRQFFEDCYIEGDIDFIFGSATAVFHRCEIFSRDRGLPVNGYITAASTYPRFHHGYVFLNCRLTGNAGENSVYLGRPWRAYSKVAFIGCWMGAHIHHAGWHNWDKPEREQTVTYIEYQNDGPGASTDRRVPWMRTLTPEEAGQYTIESVLAGTDGWRPDLL